MTAPGIVAMIVVLGLSALATWALRSGGAGDGADEIHELFEVARGSFEIRIPATGELAAARQIEIKNRLESRAIITEVAEEGTIVKIGDLLVKFNDEEIRTRLTDAEESVIATQNELDSAVADLEIKKKTRESEIEKAQLKIEIAELDYNGWIEGEVVSTRQDLKLAVETAELNFNRLEQRFEASGRLFEQEFISEDEYKQDEIALVEARARLDQVKLDVDVYEKFTYEKDRKQKMSDLSQARKEYSRIVDRQNAEVQRAESNVFSRTRRLGSKQERLAKHREQLEHCTILAPQGGLVVYASSLDSFRWMRREGRSIQVGTELWRNQMVMILPDTANMVAEVKINESLTGLIEPGQRATLTCNAAPDEMLTGQVESIGVLAESGDWKDPNRRDYTVRIKLDDVDGMGLKPSMRVQSNIKIDEVDDALNVPIQAIHREGSNIFVYVPQGAGYAQRRVEVGRSSEFYIEVMEGLDAGEQVLLREPQVEEVLAKLPPSEDVADDRSLAKVDDPPTEETGDLVAETEAQPEAVDAEMTGDDAAKPAESE